MKQNKKGMERESRGLFVSHLGFLCLLCSSFSYLVYWCCVLLVSLLLFGSLIMVIKLSMKWAKWEEETRSTQPELVCQVMKREKSKGKWTKRASFFPYLCSFLLCLLLFIHHSSLFLSSFPPITMVWKWSVNWWKGERNKERGVFCFVLSCFLCLFHALHL